MSTVAWVAALASACWTIVVLRRALAAEGWLKASSTKQVAWLSAGTAVALTGVGAFLQFAAWCVIVGIGYGVTRLTAARTERSADRS